MQIKLCSNCKGQGVLENRGQEGYEKLNCRHCEGTGRVEFKSYEIEVPFGKQIDNDIEKKILELIYQIQSMSKWS
tara:strand:- start:229 stop:453 length:225 start_codon:yes stop_codon:yes gene_type:complete